MGRLLSSLVNLEAAGPHPAPKQQKGACVPPVDLYCDRPRCGRLIGDPSNVGNTFDTKVLPIDTSTIAHWVERARVCRRLDITGTILLEAAIDLSAQAQ